MLTALFYFEINLSDYSLEKTFKNTESICVLKIVFEEFNIFMEIILFNFKQ